MPNHRVTVDWMGSKVDTLEDLLRPGLKALCIGINPSLVSVKAGHYYQGRLGRAFFSRLIGAGVVPSDPNDFMDDVAFRSGVGFTDLVKRPTKGARELRAEEFEFGKDLLTDKIKQASPQLVIFTFKATAVKMLGPFDGNGFIGQALEGSEVFVMPGPYENASTALRTLDLLSERMP